MKAILLVLPLVALSSAEFCFNNIAQSCTVAGEPINCSSKFSAVHQVMPELHSYFYKHITHSFQHLLMATHFSNYEKNREGFSKLYRKLSDKSWENAIDLLKYITKRGGAMDFDITKPAEPNPRFENDFEMYELESLSRSLDMHKSLAEAAHKIHSSVTKRLENYHDAETISFLEEKFVHKHADIIRDLAGYTNDLSKLIKGHPDASLGIYLFDEYLQSQ